MISNLDIQANYNHLYESLRKYIWPFDVVSAIADLEVACYQACPTLLEIGTRLRHLQRCVYNVVRSDESLSAEFDSFLSDIDNADGVYTVLNQVSEVKSIEDTEI